MFLTAHTAEQLRRARADVSRELDHKTMMNELIALAWTAGYELDQRDVSREAFRCLDAE